MLGTRDSVENKLRYEFLAHISYVVVKWDGLPGVRSLCDEMLRGSFSFILETWLASQVENGEANTPHIKHSSRRSQ